MLALADIPRLLRVAEAARVLAISPRKLWSLTDCGEIPCVRIGRSVRYDPVDLSNWIEAKKQREGGHNPGHRGQCSRDGIS
ncbi:MAG: helix-turn-helix domain-containing protein [Planctomycetes bacterium]|nr:helix-turn-helix domain-containing protein [Planctomycetota bacterium]